MQMSKVPIISGYVGIGLWTTVRYVLCFSSGIVSWATTVDFGGVCIVFLFRYFTLGYDCGLRSDMYYVSLQIFYLGIRLWATVRYVLCFSSGIVSWATTVDFGGVCIMFLFMFFTLGYDCGLRWGMYYVSLQILYLRLRLWTSVRYVLCFSSGIVPWATTVDFGQICIVFLFRYFTLGYDCGLLSGMYYVSLQIFYLGIRLWTTVRYVLCFSSDILPWDTTVDFGRVCIVFLFRYFTLGYDCGLRSDMYCVSLQVLYFGLRRWTSVRYVLCCSSGSVPWATTMDFGQICIVFLLLYLGLRLWTSVRYVLCFSTCIVPWATIVDFGQICIVFLLLYLGLRLLTTVRYVLCFSSGISPWATTVDFGQICIVFLFRYCILG